MAYLKLCDVVVLRATVKEMFVFGLEGVVVGGGCGRVGREGN